MIDPRRQDAEQGSSHPRTPTSLPPIPIGTKCSEGLAETAAVGKGEKESEGWSDVAHAGSAVREKAQIREENQEMEDAGGSRYVCGRFKAIPRLMKLNAHSFKTFCGDLFSRWGHLGVPSKPGVFAQTGNVGGLRNRTELALQVVWREHHTHTHINCLLP